MPNKGSQRGKRQYTNPVRAAIAKSSGIADAGTRASASQRIKGDSMLAKRGQPQYTNGTQNFLRRMGVPTRDEKKANGRPKRTSEVRIVRNRANDRTITMHNAAVKDPTTGFGINVNVRQKAYKLSFS